MNAPDLPGDPPWGWGKGLEMVPKAGPALGGDVGLSAGSCGRGSVWGWGTERARTKGARGSLGQTRGVCVQD